MPRVRRSLFEKDRISMTRVCKKCGEEKPLDLDHFASTGHVQQDGKRGIRHSCILCHRQRARERNSKRDAEYRAKHGVGYHTRPEFRRAKIKHMYGLDVDPDSLPKNCQICDVEVDYNICIDHCHTTGRIRGFLCRRCNLLLGNAQDDPNLLRRMADYLEK